MKMKKFISIKGIFILILCGIMLSVIPSTSASAAKMTNQKAWKILSKKIDDKYCRFAFYDIDNDKIDEMFVFGYSGEFTDGDDTEKTLTVYKVKNGKAKAIFRHSVQGDYFRPSLDMRLYYNGSYYMSVKYIHEGYGYVLNYKYNGKKFSQVSGIDMDLAEGTNVYTIGRKNVSKKKYDKYMKDKIAFETELEFDNGSPRATFSEYVRKLLKADYDHRCEMELFEEQPTGTSFVNIDDDWYDEMRVDTGKNSGYILYHYHGEEYERNNVYVGISRFNLDEQGDYVFDESDEEAYIRRMGYGDPYVGRWIDTDQNNFYIDVVKKGEKYVFDVQYYPNAFDLEQWIYSAEYWGHRDYEEYIYFECLEGGKHIVHSTDKATGEETENIRYTDGSATFVLEGDKLYWVDYSDDAGEDRFFEKAK
ncbi:MAG: hypothetical protein K6E62_04240 [Lachnospiraceae bacterium]|nr:hypothetical protein [Lachnospiraceae bacterium]